LFPTYSVAIANLVVVQILDKLFDYFVCII